MNQFEMQTSKSSDCLPLVSIVTPVYNTESYLQECIESVLRQTYTNWEYIILNNKSTDGTQRIAESYARKDERIRVINSSKHLKQMQNCNRAFHYISSDSKYCKVIHADDWLFPDCISRMVAVAEAHPTVGIVASYRLDETIVNLDGLPFPSYFTDGRAIAKRHLLGGSYLFGSPSSLLIRSDQIRKRPFVYDASTTHGDVLACLDILRECDFGFVHQVLTYTRRHNESATSAIKKYATYKLLEIQSLFKYGEIYLSKSEYNERLKKIISSYYRFLAVKVIELKNISIFKFHRTELRKIGYDLSNFKFIYHLFWQALNIPMLMRLILSRPDRT